MVISLFLCAVLAVPCFYAEDIDDYLRRNNWP